MDPKREAARRWVRRQRTFYIVLVVYVALVGLWFLIDAVTGSDDWWFYWPTLGAGVIVLIIGLSMFGLGGLFGAGWQQQQEERYLERHRDSDEGDDQGTEGSVETPGVPPPP